MQRLWIYLGLVANVLIFFAKPLFTDTYLFPWDFRYVQLPLISFLAEELSHGRFPFWDPYTYCGNPIFANIQASFFHPMVLAGAFLSAHTSLDSLPQILEWMVALQIAFAGIAAFHLFRGLGARAPSAFAGAIIFETGGYFVSQTEHIGAVMAVAWMPLAWLSVLRLSRNRSWRWLAILSVSLGMAVFGGFPQATMAVFVSTAVLSGLLALFKKARWSLAPIVLAGCALGIGLAAVQFIPTSQITNYSVAKYRADWLGTGGGLYWQSFVSLVAPNHYHLFDLAQFKGPGDLSFLYLYGSLAGLALVLYSLVFGKHSPYIPILAAMMLFGAFWMLGDKTPIWRALFPLLPVSIRIGIHPEYTYANFTLPFAGLAALGLDRLPVKDLVRWSIALLIAADLFLVGSGRPMNCTSVLEEPGLTREAFDGSSELLQTLRQIVGRDSPAARIDTMDASINWAECATLTRVPAANGSSPLGLENPIRLEMLALLHPGVRWGWFYQIENPDSPVLDIMNVKYLLASSRAAAALKSNPRYRLAADLPGNELYENTAVLPRYFLVNSVRQASDDEAVRLIRDHAVDLHTTALTDQPVHLAADSQADGTVRAIDYQPDFLELETAASHPSFLVLSESFYPGWKAWIDGHPAGIYRADLAFRGLLLPSGTHHVTMRFQPHIFWISLGVSMITLVLLVAMAVTAA